MEDIRARAEELGLRKDTEWAEENSALYEDFASCLEDKYAAGEISAATFNELICIALYDYDDLKEEE